MRCLRFTDTFALLEERVPGMLQRQIEELGMRRYIHLQKCVILAWPCFSDHGQIYGLHLSA
jgi:hypothetical protein